MVSVPVTVNPELLRWAIDRAGLQVEDLVNVQDFKKLPDWLDGKANPTFRQLEKFSKKTMAPFGYLLLEEPPGKELSIPDYRTPSDIQIDLSLIHI